MLRQFKLILPVCCAFAMTACNDNPDDGNAPQPNIGSNTPGITGVVADGYIQGAIVCLDRNGNLQCDADEPKTITDSKGHYSLKEVSKADSGKFRVLAEIPVGAIDSDTPGKPVDKAYFMTAPVGKHAFISPLTTLVVGEMQNHPGLTSEQAADLTAFRLHTTANHLLANYLTSVDDDAKSLQWIAKVTQGHLADYLRLMELSTDYSPADAPLRLRAFTTLHIQQLPWLLAQFNQEPETLRPLYTPEMADISTQQARHALHQARQPLEFLSIPDFIRIAQPVFAIDNAYGDNCRNFVAPSTPCPANFPFMTAQTRQITTSVTQQEATIHSVPGLMDLTTGLDSSVPQPEIHDLQLTALGWLPVQGDERMNLQASADNSLTKLDLTGMSIREFFSENHDFNLNILKDSDFYNTIRADAAFTAGSIAYFHLKTHPERRIFIRDINFTDHVTTLPTTIPLKTLTEFVDAYSDKGGQRYGLLTNMGYDPNGVGSFVANKTLVQFSDSNRLKITQESYNPQGELIKTRQLPDGYWKKELIAGQEVIIPDFPSLPWMGGTVHGVTVYDHQVVWVSIEPSGFQSEEIYFNKMAMDAIRDALKKAP